MSWLSSAARCPVYFTSIFSSNRHTYSGKLKDNPAFEYHKSQIQTLKFVSRPFFRKATENGFSVSKRNETVDYARNSQGMYWVVTLTLLSTIVLVYIVAYLVQAI